MEIKEELKKILIICYNIKENLLTIMKMINEKQNKTQIKQNIFLISQDLNSIIQYIKSYFSHYLILPEHNQNLTNSITEYIISTPSQTVIQKEEEIINLNNINKKKNTLFEYKEKERKTNNEKEKENINEDYLHMSELLYKFDSKINKISDSLFEGVDIDKIHKNLRQNKYYDTIPKDIHHNKIIYFNKVDTNLQNNNQTTTSNTILSDDLLKLLNKV